MCVCVRVCACVLIRGVSITCGELVSCGECLVCDSNKLCYELGCGRLCVCGHGGCGDMVSVVWVIKDVETASV